MSNQYELEGIVVKAAQTVEKRLNRFGHYHRGVTHSEVEITIVLGKLTGSLVLKDVPVDMLTDLVGAMSKRSDIKLELSV